MIYEIIWNTDGENPSNMELPKYVVISNDEFNIPNVSGDNPDMPVFHIIPADFPEIDMDEELADIMSDIFDWAVSSFYEVSNTTFDNDMSFFTQNKYVNYEFN